MPKKKKETQPKKKLKGTKNQWQARLSKHNWMTGILDDDSMFGTASFTRLQLWTMLGQDSGLREWNRQVQAAIPSRTH
jgi:hypothetical protein